MSASIGVRTRKRLWLRSGGLCAFPGCEMELLHPVDEDDEDTIVGVECHIVSQSDEPAKIARSESALTEDEKARFAPLVSDRHGFANLVLMCGGHHTVIDDPRGDWTVERVVEVKRSHEASMQAGRSPQEQEQDVEELRLAKIVEDWEQKLRLDEWSRWMGGVFSDGHPRMEREDFDRLNEARTWMFSRVWPDEETPLQAAFENFRWVAQDLSLTLALHPHEQLARSGVVAPTRFYNDAAWHRRFDGDHQRLDAAYEWYAFLLEDLALELTRAANLVCEAVRDGLDPSYRLSEGLVTLESGPYMDFNFRLHRPTYARAERWRPYTGLERFITERGTRDECRDDRPRPEGLPLPFDGLP